MESAIWSCDVESVKWISLRCVVRDMNYRGLQGRVRDA